MSNATATGASSVVAALRNPAGVLEPGGAATCEISVLNTGSIVDEFAVDVIGAPGLWATVEPPVLALFPNTQQVVTVTFRPPRSHEVAPGPTPFAVRVVPAASPANCVTEEGMLVVAPFNDLSAELIPQQVEGRRSCKVRVAVDSRGNLPLTVDVVASDPAAAVRFAVRPARLELRPGQASFATVRLVPARYLWRHSPRQHRFTVGIEIGGDTHASLAGTYVQRPVVARWALVLAALLAALVLWLAVVGPTIRNTATAAANTETQTQVAQRGTDQRALQAQGAEIGALQHAVSSLSQKAGQSGAGLSSAQASEVDRLAGEVGSLQRSEAGLSKEVAALRSGGRGRPAPAPTSRTVDFSGALPVVVANASAGSPGYVTATWTVPAHDTFLLSDLVLSTVSPGESGGVRVQLDPPAGPAIPNPLTLVETTIGQLGAVPSDTVKLETPIDVAAGTSLALTVSCEPQQGACYADLLFSGVLRSPEPGPARAG